MVFVLYIYIPYLKSKHSNIHVSFYLFDSFFNLIVLKVISKYWARITQNNNNFSTILQRFGPLSWNRRRKKGFQKCLYLWNILTFNKVVSIYAIAKQNWIIEYNSIENTGFFRIFLTIFYEKSKNFMEYYKLIVWFLICNLFKFCQYVLYLVSIAADQETCKSKWINKWIDYEFNTFTDLLITEFQQLKILYYVSDLINVVVKYFCLKKFCMWRFKDSFHLFIFCTLRSLLF